MSYPGGKSVSGAWQTIINLMPPHTVYIEPFLGAGAVLARKRPAPLSIGVDIDRAALDLAIAAVAGSGLKVAGIGTVGEWARRRPSESARPDPLASSGGADVRLLEGDAIEFLEGYPWAGGELIYCDPPYVMSARRSQRRLYRHEMNDVEHRRLLRVLRSLSARVIISGYSTALYAGELRAWHARSFRTSTRGGGTAAEWLWFNFPPPVELHDYRFLGSDFRERERIRRKQRRWKNRLAGMDLSERQALLSILAESGILKPA